MKLYTDKSGCVRCFPSKDEAFKYFNGLREEYLSKSYSWGKKFAETIDEIIEVPTPFNPKKEIHDADSFSEYCNNLLDCWLENIQSDTRYCRPMREGDMYLGDADPANMFVYTSKGNSMVERAIDRIGRVGCKHYDELDIDIKTSYFQEL